MRLPLGKWAQIALDLFALTGSVLLALVLRYDGVPSWAQSKPLLLCAPYIVALQYAVLVGLGVTSFAWRFIGLRDAGRLLAALALAALCLGTIRAIAPGLAEWHPVFRNAIIPYGVIVIDLTLAFCALAGIRGLRRIQVEHAERTGRGRPSRPALRTLLVGAGPEGVAVAREIASRPDLGLELVGFVDDDSSRRGTRIHGLVVHGTTRDLEALCARLGVRQALITIPDASGDTIRAILDQCERVGVAAKTVPGLHEIVSGRARLGALKDVAIDDLLRRVPVRLDSSVVRDHIAGRVVLVTGAGGSIGSEICRQLVRFEPSRIVLIERSELALFEIHRELMTGSPCAVVPCMADVTDAPRIGAILETHRPSVIFHAAAHKHVPLMEQNVGEAIKNNVGGTRVMADLAITYAAESFVMISTDKAVNPTSVMGATKRASELYLQALSERGTSTRFTAVRFGNVLGSSGSVLHLFREQIARGGPVQVTHPEMRRYFMTIPEACQLVLQAGAMGRGGEIFILDMGKPVRIVDLATDLIRLSGLIPGEHVKIDFVGLRAGEKLFEELAFDEEHARKTSHEKIFIGQLAHVDAQQVENAIRHLLNRSDRASDDEHRRELKRLVPEFAGSVALPVAPASSDLPTMSTTFEA